MARWWVAAGLLASVVGGAPPALADGDPTAARAAYEDAAQAMKLQDYDRARVSLRRSADLDPSDTEALLKLGMLESRLQHWEASIVAYDELLSRDPLHIKALNNLGNVHYRQGRYERASSLYARALEQRPEYLLALFHQGRVLWQLNRAEEATSIFERCLSLRPETPQEGQTQFQCLFYRGTLRFRAADYEGARADIERVIETMPSHLEARHYLAQIYRRLGRNDEARQQFEIHRRMLESMRSQQPIEKQAP